MSIPGRAIVYPPIRESTDEVGIIVYTVDLSTGPESFQFLDPVPREEAHFRVRETLRQGLIEGRYRPRDFYPLTAMEMYDTRYYSPDAILDRYRYYPDRYRYYYPQQQEYSGDDDDMGADDADGDGHGQEEAYGQQQQQQCFGGVPASGEAIVSLPETSVKEGECSVCLESFEAEAGNSKKKLRMMPCSHSFHERCIFDWLCLSHVCPLCRFPLPTQEDEEDGQ